MQKPSKIILGIDPGTLVMGYGVIIIINNEVKLKEMNVLKLSSKKDHYERLEMIHFTISELISIHQPDEFAIEAPFFGKNVQSMLKLGRAQGVAIAAAMRCSIPVTEYSPKKIKQSITGNGNADKDQVWKMLKQILLLETKPKHFDATDAVAVAICHHFQGNSLVSKTTIRKKTPGKKSSWEDFIKMNPQKLKR